MAAKCRPTISSEAQANKQRSVQGVMKYFYKWLQIHVLFNCLLPDSLFFPKKGEKRPNSIKEMGNYFLVRNMK